MISGIVSLFGDEPITEDVKVGEPFAISSLTLGGETASRCHFGTLRVHERAQFVTHRVRDEREDAERVGRFD
jgi:hypothetical protein